MIDFPCAKINLGLNITEKRADGYHNLETVFFPIPICDALEIKTMDERFPSNVACDLKVTGNNVCCNENDNLIVKAYNMIAADFDIPRVHAHLYKNIPSEAGLGGGSSDAAYMIRLLDQRFRINIGNAEMEKYAARLGADCPFFITAEPSYAEGIGEILSPVNITDNNLEGYSLVVVKPQIAVSTKEAFSNITPRKPLMCCREIVAQPIETWKDALCNDFEESVFGIYPKLNDIKNRIYTLGAAYAQMSGSGSSLFGIFKSDVDEQSIKNEFADCRTFVMKL
ncbi:MAG: 4-(cytidine 5'-diphospho)-2-C-methyl-D-erythritol kinase [Prevotella sp.]|uniref:4-(cytidine 5'-diphospho)-2-C-methyl-D-erythritol kinase n=1 Tax=Prevotella sp. TaxID=59823 RepID=UPI0025FCA18B|nr:4-(cytidine 5'-diphospho)-2-C-methyl-D-erythritol kinase [Prevotella sp.]MCI7119335.1 4-(cytidine 5'-diphospho)-2-C-methyl-D-erythritol kinase [Prevotella sp.]